MRGLGLVLQACLLGVNYVGTVGGEDPLSTPLQPPQPPAIILEPAAIRPRVQHLIVSLIFTLHDSNTLCCRRGLTRRQPAPVQPSITGSPLRNVGTSSSAGGLHHFLIWRWSPPQKMRAHTIAISNSKFNCHIVCCCPSLYLSWWALEHSSLS